MILLPLDLELPLIIQPVTSALIVTSPAVPMRRVMGCAILAALVGYVYLIVWRILPSTPVRAVVGSSFSLEMIS
jgi:hypothetical protein